MARIEALLRRSCPHPRCDALFRLSEKIFREVLSVPILDCVRPEEVAALIWTFEKRHLITHNLGVVDRKYIEHLRSAEREGREIRIAPEEISAAIRTVLRILSSAHNRLFARN